MENKDSTRGWIFDLVNGIANDLAITNHLHEAFYAATKDFYDEVDGASQKMEDYRSLLLLTLKNRRSKMKTLIAQADEYDKRMWCPLKHAIESYMEAMEVWQAHETPETFQQMIDSTEVMSGILSVTLGLDLETCARCLSDFLKEN